MENYSFTKMNGAGNDFIVFDFDAIFDLELTPVLIRNLCHRQFGIGADGIITVKNSGKSFFEMEYFNSDGNKGSLCGNGARCALKFASIKEKFTGHKTEFIFDGDSYSGEIIDTLNVKFNLLPPKKIQTNFKIDVKGQSINASFADTGSPHVVININDILCDAKDAASGCKSLSEIDVIDLGREIRYCADFAPNGTNVNFISIVDNEIAIRTYERGVENETLACGTGSVAAALTAFVNYGINPPVIIRTVANKILIVDFNSNGQRFDNLSLTGPAEVNFTGSFDLNFYK